MEAYKTTNGEYPEELRDLVPEFLPEIPLPRPLGLLTPPYRLHISDGQHLPIFISGPPFGKKIYHFEEQDWGYVD